MTGCDPATSALTGRRSNQTELHGLDFTLISGEDRIRTDNRLYAKQMLYQLELLPHVAGATPYSVTPADGIYLLRPSPDVEPSDASHTRRVEIPRDAELGVGD